MVERRARFNLAKANKRLHLVEGFLAALTDLDQIVKTIRAANDGTQQPSGHPVCPITAVSILSHKQLQRGLSVDLLTAYAGLAYLWPRVRTTQLSILHNLHDCHIC